MICDPDLLAEMYAWGHTVKVRSKTRTGGDPLGPSHTTADSATAFPCIIQPLTAEEMEKRGRLGIDANFNVFMPVLTVTTDGVEVTADKELVGVTPDAHKDWIFQIVGVPRDVMAGAATITEGRHLEIDALVDR